MLAAHEMEDGWQIDHVTEKVEPLFGE